MHSSPAPATTATTSSIGSARNVTEHNPRLRYGFGMAVTDSLRPAARGRRVEHVGPLRESAATDDLAARLEADGYLFLRGLLDRDAVVRGREDLLAQPALEQTYPMRSAA